MKTDNKLIIVTSKWPGKSDSSDGGNSTVRELIDIFTKQYLVDILYLGNQANSAPRKGVHETIYYNYDFDHYESYAKIDDSKFTIRIKQAHISAKVIKKYVVNYERVIVIHNMFLLGMNPNDESILKKVILFPMFTGEDYKLSGEIVPNEYILKEKMLLNKVKAIVVPSHREKKTLMELYNVNEGLINVIHRCVDRFPYKEHSIKSETIKMIYIASVRKQKSHIEAVLLLEKLVSCGLNINLTCIGKIQDYTISEMCVKKAKELNIGDRLYFTGNLEYDALNDELIKADINISVSIWETFGRGIFEGLAAGIPTVVLSRIESIKDITNNKNSPIMCKNIEEMACKICELIKSESKYLKECKKGMALRTALSSDVTRAKLDKVLK